jgi:hypothetical protein
MRRIGIALCIAAAIYGIGAGTGLLLYATGAIATGPTHNDCANFRAQIAEEQGIDEEDVPQSAIKQRTEECLAGHELEPREALRTEFLLGAAWPAAIVPLVYLVWPRWSAALHRQEQHDEELEAAAAAAEREAGMA